MQSSATTSTGSDVDRQGLPVIALADESLYAFGRFIRSIEQLLLDLFAQGLLSGTTHTCIGQELCQIGVARALRGEGDVLLSNHRNHGHFLAYGGDALGLVAEIMGRRDGVCRGYGGSQHLAHRGFHSNGVQGGLTAIAVGQALAAKRRERRAVVAVVIGDGTLGEGLVYESLNLASVWQVPVLFVVEHNRIAQTTATRDTVAGDIGARGRAFGIDTWRLDDADPRFCAKAADVVETVRHSGEPGLLVIDTRRAGPHSKGDDLRSEGERAEIAQRDPLTALGRRLPPARLEAIDACTARHVQAVYRAALESPPARFEAVPQSALRPALPPTVTPQPASMPSVRAALNAALRTLLDERDDVLLLGEDLHDPYGGAFKVTAGLSTAFPSRVISTPISEAGLAGAAIGLAMAGMRPVVEVMFADFLSLCLDQLYNHAVKFPGMFPHVSVPMVLRAPCGARRGYGPTHSQSPEHLLVSVPGLTVLYGSPQHNNGQLLVDACTRWPNPTVFLEHKLLYSQPQQPEDFRVLDADARDPGAALFPTLRSGSDAPDLTVVCFGGMVPIVQRVAQRLRDEEELAVELVVPCLLAPLPRRTLHAALSARVRIAVVEESHHEHGVGAEIAASLLDAGWAGRLLRIGTPGVPIAAARSLESEQLPDEGSIFRRLLDWL